MPEQLENTNPLSVISLERLRHETRQPSTFVGHNDHLIELLKDAIDFVSKEISRPLLRISEIESISTPFVKTCPIYIFKSDILSIIELKYWTEDVSLRDDPDGTLDITTLGRLEIRNQNCYVLYPPETGWPLTLRSSRFKVMMNRHWPISLNNQNQGLKRAIVVHTREAYDGNLTILTLKAIRSLINSSMSRSGG